MYFHQAKTKKCVGQKGFGEDNGGGDDDNRRRKGGGELKKQEEKERAIGKKLTCPVILPSKAHIPCPSLRSFPFMFCSSSKDSQSYNVNNSN